MRCVKLLKKKIADGIVFSLPDCIFFLSEILYFVGIHVGFLKKIVVSFLENRVMYLVCLNTSYILNPLVKVPEDKD